MLHPNLKFLQFQSEFNNVNYSDVDFKKLVNQFVSKNRAFNQIQDNLPETLKQIQISHNYVNFKVQTVVILGIGGSALGSKTIIDLLEARGVLNVKIHYIDSVDPDTISHLSESLDFSSTLFFVISNSGNTIETLALTYFFLSQAESHACDIQTHFQFIIGKKLSEIYKLAIKYKCPIFYWPDNLCGRLSYFSLPSLIPASYAGVDIKDFLQAGSKVNLKYMLDSPELNSALKLAAIYSKYLKLGYKNIVLFNYSDRLKSFGEWAVQLISESLGKNQSAPNIQVSRGVTDQHSALQLYKEGPNDKFYIFIHPQKFKKNPSITNFYNKPVSYLDKETFGRLHKFEMQGTMSSLVSANRPVIELAVPELSNHNACSLAMFFMFFTIYLAEILNIDAFNQPGVEESKQITRQLLEVNKIYYA